MSSHSIPAIVKIFIAFVVIIFIFIFIVVSLVSSVFSRPESSFTQLTKNNTQILDLPKCGISVEFPQEFEGRPLVAFQPPQNYIHRDNAAIGGNFYTETGAVIGNSHMDEEGQIKNIEINCKPLKDVKKDDWFVRDNEKFSKEEFQNTTNWDIAKNDISDISRSVLSNDWTQSFAKRSPQYTRSFYFSHKDNQIIISHLFRNDSSWFGFQRKSGLYANQINITEIGKTTANTTLQKNIWEWTEPEVTVEKKEVSFDLNFNDGKKLSYKDTYIWKIKNGQKIGNQNSYVQTTVNFEGRQLLNTTNLYINEKDNFNEPLYKVGLKQLGDYYSFQVEFQRSQFLRTSVDAGKTWIDDKFFPDSYNEEYGNPWMSNECGKVTGNADDYYLCGLLSTTFSHNPSGYSSTGFKQQFINNSSFIERIGSVKNVENGLEVTLQNVSCPVTNNKPTATPPCLEKVFFNKTDNGYAINWKQIYEQAKIFTNDSKNAEKIKTSRERALENRPADRGSINEENRPVRVERGQIVNGDVVVKGGKLNIEPNAIIKGNLIVDKTEVKILANVTIEGSITINSGNLAMEDKTTIKGSINAINAYVTLQSNSKLADVFITGGGFYAQKNNQIGAITSKQESKLTVSNISLVENNTIKGNIISNNKIYLGTGNIIEGNITAEKLDQKAQNTVKGSISTKH